MCMGKGTRAFNILKICIKTPIRALGRACEFYVRSMTGCAGRMPHGPIFGVSGGVFSTLPADGNHGFYRPVVDDDDDDYYRELVWAASNKNLGPGLARPIGVGARYRSAAAMERIDEDEDCEFTDDADLGLNPQSRSCTAVA